MNPDDFEKQLQQRPFRVVSASWRADILQAASVASAAAASAAPAASRPAPSLFSTINHHLSAVLWPCPQAWAGLAAVWLVILAVNYSNRDKSEVVAAKSPPPSPEMIMVVQEQRKMLAKLVEPYDQSPAEPPKPFVPRPRSECFVNVVSV